MYQPYWEKLKETMHVPCYIQTFTLIFFHAKVFIAFLVYVNWIFVHNSTMLTLGNRKEFLPFYAICYPCPMFSMVKRYNRSVLCNLFSSIAMVCHFVINVLCFPWSREISDLLSILFISLGLPLSYPMNVFHSQGDNRYLIWYLFCLSAMVCHFVISWMFSIVKEITDIWFAIYFVYQPWSATLLSHECFP